MTMRSVGVMQEITRSDKLKVRSARFNREAEAAEAGRAVALANLRRDTAMAWLDRYYQERMLDVLRTQRTEAGLQIEAADAAYRGGRGTQADVFAARSMVAQIDDRIRQTEKQIGTAKIRLARWVGDDAAQALDTPPSLEVRPPRPVQPGKPVGTPSRNRVDDQAGRGGARRCGCRAEQQTR
jgi:outer membrane protein TolC